MMTEAPAQDDESNDLFYFETDHLAVKGNKDYSELLKTLFILQAQQQRAIKVSLQNSRFPAITGVSCRTMKK